MTEYEKIDALLKKDINFFDAESMKDTKDKLSDLIYSNDRGIFVLFGETGVGKTRLINSIIDEVKDDIFSLESPPTLEREFLEEIYFQLRSKKFSNNVKIDEMRVRVNDAFKKISHTIIVDNISSSHSVLIEEIGSAININMKDLKVIFIIDKYFQSHQDISNFCKCTIQDSISVDSISKDDLQELFSTTFNNFDIKKERAIILNDFDYIYEITEGNILKFNKFIRTIFDILSTANRENIGKFKKLNKCVLLMSALDNELIDG